MAAQGAHCDIYKQELKLLYSEYRINRRETQRGKHITGSFNTWFIMYHRQVVVILVNYITVFIISMHEIHNKVISLLILEVIHSYFPFGFHKGTQ